MALRGRKSRKKAMSEPTYDVDEVLYGLYQSWCRAHHEVPSLRDFVVWKDEQYPDADTPDWNEIDTA